MKGKLKASLFPPWFVVVLVSVAVELVGYAAFYFDIALIIFSSSCPSSVIQSNPVEKLSPV
jgi:hypothetical protein